MTKRDREIAVENVLKRWRKLQEEIKAVEDDAAIRCIEMYFRCGT